MKRQFLLEHDQIQGNLIIDADAKHIALGGYLDILVRNWKLVLFCPQQEDFL